MRRKKLVLVISRDYGLADVRYRTLVGAGYDVIAATDIRGVAAGVAAHPDAIMIGQSVPAPEKRRIWSEIRGLHTPVLELHQGTPTLPGAHHHRSQTPEDFLETLNELLRRRPAHKTARKGV